MIGPIKTPCSHELQLLWQIKAKIAKKYDNNDNNKCTGSRDDDLSSKKDIIFVSEMRIKDTNSTQLLTLHSMIQN